MSRIIQGKAMPKKEKKSLLGVGIGLGATIAGVATGNPQLALYGGGKTLGELGVKGAEDVAGTVGEFTGGDETEPKTPTKSIQKTLQEKALKMESPRTWKSRQMGTTVSGTTQPRKHGEITDEERRRYMYP